MKDGFDREIDYLRVSVTKECNLRCGYCRPKGEVFKKIELLSFDEIERVCRAFCELGVNKIKITGGEPLLREGVTELIGRLKAIDGVTSVTLTTNGVLCEKYAEELKAAGLDRVNVSLDSLDRKVYEKITGCDRLYDVLRGIDALYDVGLPVRINTVIQRGINEGEVLRLGELAKEREIDVRFIELMPIGQGKGFEPVGSVEVMKAFEEKGLKLLKSDYRGNGPAVYYSIERYKGRIGFISPLSENFCKGCGRLRLSSDGFLKGCLMKKEGLSLKEALAERDDALLKAVIENVVLNKPFGGFVGEAKNDEVKDMIEIGG